MAGAGAVAAGDLLYGRDNLDEYEAHAARVVESFIAKGDLDGAAALAIILRHTSDSELVISGGNITSRISRRCSLVCARSTADQMLGRVNRCERVCGRMYAVNSGECFD